MNSAIGGPLARRSQPVTNARITAAVAARLQGAPGRLPAGFGGVIRWQIYCVYHVLVLTRILVILLSSVAATACGGDRARDETPAKLAAIDTSRVNVSAGSVTRRAARTRGDTNAYPAVRGLYLNRFAPQSVRKMRHLFAIADSTEINAFVIDMKDEFGLNYHSAKPEIARNAGGTHGFGNDVRALVDSVKAHGLIPI